MSYIRKGHATYIDWNFFQPCITVEEVGRLAFAHFLRVYLQNQEGGQVLIKSPFDILSRGVTPRNVVKATCMMEDAHVAGRPDGWLSGPVAQIHLFASIYQENELFIRILARSDGRTRTAAGRGEAKTLRQRWIYRRSNEHARHADCHPLFQGCNHAREIIFAPWHSQCVRLLYLPSLQYEWELRTNYCISHSS